MGWCLTHNKTFEGTECPRCANEKLREALEQHTEELQRTRDEEQRIHDEELERSRRDTEAFFERMEDTSWEQASALEDTLREADNRQRKNIAKALREQKQVSEQQLAQQREQISEDWKLRSQALTKRAYQLYEISMFSEAAATGFNAIKEDSGNIEAYIVTSRALARQGFTKQATPLYEKQITLLNLRANSHDAELVLRVFEGLPAHQSLQHSFLQVIRRIVVDWPNIQARRFQLTDYAPLLIAMFRTGQRGNAKALLSLLLSMVDSRFEDCVVLLKGITTQEGLTGFEAGEVLPDLVLKPDLQIDPLLSILRPMIAGGAFTRAAAKALIDTVTSRTDSVLAKCIPIFTLLVESALVDATEAKHLLATVMRGSLTSTDSASIRISDCIPLLDTLIRKRLFTDSDANELLNIVLSEKNARLAEYVPLFTRIIDGVLDRTDAPAFLNRLVANTKLRFSDCKPLFESAINLITDTDDAKEFLRALLSKDESRVPQWTQLFDAMISRGTLADADVAELLRVVSSGKHCRFDDCVSLLGKLISHGRMKAALIVIERFRQDSSLDIEGRLRLEAYSLEATRPRDASDKILKAFLREIPSTDRRALATAFRRLQDFAATVPLSAATIDTIKIRVAERYQEWQQEIERSLNQTAHRWHGVVSAAEKTSLLTSLAFGCAVVILWMMAAMLTLHWAPFIALYFGGPNALSLLLLFSPLAGLFAGVLRRISLRTASFREELKRLKSAEASEWQEIVGRRPDVEGALHDINLLNKRIDTVNGTRLRGSELTVARFAWLLAFGGFAAGGVLGLALRGIIERTGVEASSWIALLIALFTITIWGAWRAGALGAIGAFFGWFVANGFAEVVGVAPSNLNGVMPPGFDLFLPFCCGEAYCLLLFALARPLFILRQKGSRSFIVVVGLIAIALADLVAIFGGVTVRQGK
jgi:hypothetical protein